MVMNIHEMYYWDINEYEFMNWDRCCRWCGW
jgi:hypothetical protein